MRLARLWRCQARPGQFPLVQSRLGHVEGFLHETYGTHHQSHVFLGIPYAKPPIGDLRLERPQPYGPWNVTLKAHNYSLCCVPHFDSDNTAPTGEDCLTLNVIRPAEKSEDPKGYPVVFWVHPSCYNVGSSQWLKYEEVAENFVNRGVIAITFNYRLGVLYDVMPGNLGLFDQALALRWVFENIEAFGGNPNRITACGLSAGSSSVGQLVLSPHSRDYIDKAVQLSGSYYCMWATNDKVIENTQRLAHILGCKSAESADIKKVIKETCVKVLNDAVGEMGPACQSINISRFSPRIDGEFFPQDYHKLLEEARPIPTLIGYSAHEAIFFAILGFLKSCNGITIDKNEIPKFDEAEVVHRIKTYLVTDEYFGAFTKKMQDRVIAFYLKRRVPLNPDPLFYLSRYVEIQSHMQFFIPIAFEIMEKHRQNWTMYLSKNEHFAKHHFREGTPLIGAVHASELHTFFNFPNPKSFRMNKADLHHRDIYCESICNFAKNGDPSNEYVPKWPRATYADPFRHVALRPKPEIRGTFSEDDHDAIKFWVGLWRDFGESAIRSVHFSQHTPRYEPAGSELVSAYSPRELN